MTAYTKYEPASTIQWMVDVPSKSATNGYKTEYVSAPFYAVEEGVLYFYSSEFAMTQSIVQVFAPFAWLSFQPLPSGR